MRGCDVSGASGFSHQEAADIFQVAVGSIKSRAIWAQLRLTKVPGIQDWDELHQINRNHSSKIPIVAELKIAVFAKTSS
jgi:hypothetical protein